MSSRFDRVDDWKTYAAQCLYSITRMAHGKQMSRQHLRRYFQQNLGTNPKEWIEVQRLEAAMRLLKAGKAVKEVAAELGFGHACDFSRFFHRKTGQTPRELQQMFPKATKCSPELRSLASTVSRRV